MKRLALALVLALGCSRPPATEVLVRIDAQPMTAARARALRIRAWAAGAPSDAPLYDELRALEADGGSAVLFPITVPLVPLGGDASRRFVLEATLLDEAGEAISWARLEGGYTPNEAREALLCFDDTCLLRPCELTLDCIDDPSVGCDTCREGTCTTASVTLVPLGMAPDRCPPAPACIALTDDERNCGNDVDDDCDGRRDCDDPDCLDVPCDDLGGVCGGEGGLLCVDGSDNDCDGLVDCADADCLAGRLPFETASQCSDTLDNDCNNLIDCFDPNCAFFVGEDDAVTCFDGEDNDCDGLKDCRDPSCAAFVGTESRALACTDGDDNDCDGRIDCLDPDCFGVPREQCANHRDDDCDDLCDCEDPDCAGVAAEPDELGRNCDDGLDNDCDGEIDNRDDSCLGARCRRSDGSTGHWCGPKPYSCVDIESNENHCGACGVQCGRRDSDRGPRCVEGRCACAFSTERGCPEMQSCRSSNRCACNGDISCNRSFVCDLALGADRCKYEAPVPQPVLQCARNPVP